MSEGKHITDRTARALDSAADAADMDETVPGPSPNPATNLLINEILLRSVGRISRHALEKAILGRRYGTEFAKDAIESRSLMHTLAAYGITKVATRSIPGAALVTTGLVVKTLFDRSQGRRKSLREGNKTIRKMAENGQDD